jgi:hypothetical protein
LAWGWLPGSARLGRWLLLFRALRALAIGLCWIRRLARRRSRRRGLTRVSSGLASLVRLTGLIGLSGLIGLTRLGRLIRITGLRPVTRSAALLGGGCVSRFLLVLLGVLLLIDLLVFPLALRLIFLGALLAVFRGRRLLLGGRL